MSTVSDTMVIDDQQMHITNNVAYDYTLNTTDKIITYTFADLSGTGNYYFSLDGSKLVITEGEAPNILVQLGLLADSTLSSDKAKDGVTYLERVSNNTAAAPQSTSDAVAAAKKAANEDDVS